LPDEPATEALGRALVTALPDARAGWQVLLQGELGAGKTTLARAMLRELGHQGTVPSPTYTLVEPYDLPSGKAYHVDLYRIADSNELEFLGWSELGDGLLLVEWPERAPGIAELADLRVELGYCGAGRQALLTALSERGALLLDRLQPLP
jgi:tRNA threonylcarbamoyladenosine biosynthesis protein TsaE